MKLARVFFFACTCARRACQKTCFRTINVIFRSAALSSRMGAGGSACARGKILIMDSDIENFFTKR